MAASDGVCYVMLWSVLLVTSVWAAPGPSGQAAGKGDGESNNASDHPRHRRGAKKDHHGGIPMGNVPGCDDAQSNIEVDWDPRSASEYTCKKKIVVSKKIKISKHCEEKTAEPIHECLPKKITYKDTPPTSGPHRPNWPQYGEYVYIPPQRWLHSLEHGAIVMLYHPCADEGEVERLRGVVRGCLRRHIITPYPHLPPHTPLALLSWGCKLLMNHALPHAATNFILAHAIRGPEGNVASGGQYNAGLLNVSQIVSDFYDRRLCPHFRSDNEEIQSTTPPFADEVEGMQKTGQDYGKGDINPQKTDTKGTAVKAPVNPMVEQSQLRRHQLDEKTDNTQRSIHRLAKAYQVFQKTMKS